MRRLVEALLILAVVGRAGAGWAASPSQTPAREFPVTKPDSVLIRAMPEVQGDVLDARCWTDKSGEHCFVAWGRNNKSGSENRKRSELHAAVFSMRTSGFKQDWRINDFSDQPLTWVALDTATIKVADVDGDGSAETGFFYSIAQDGLDPYVLKYILHAGAKKYAIRGMLPMDADDLERYAKQADPALQDLSSPLAKFADAEWEAYVKPILKPLQDEAAEDDK